MLLIDCVYIAILLVALTVFYVGCKKQSEHLRNEINKWAQK